MLMLHNGLQVDQKGTQMTHGRRSSFYIVDCPHMNISSITISPRILYCKIIISSIPMCYAKCHNVNKLSPLRITYVDK